ncbi:MAG: thioredoxin domain-containing protein [Alphaproteobacteria bacterium]
MVRIFGFLLVLFALPVMANAQNAVPELPAPIQNLVDEGAQIRFLGKDHGFDAWLTIKNGQEQYFYVKPDGSAFLMGVLFDKGGEMITLDQVSRLREGDDSSLLDTLTGAEFDVQGSEAAAKQSFEFKSPSERLFHDIENSNWVALGNPRAPIVYSFIDPQCPHCHKFIQDIRKDYLEKGRIQVRLIPVGFKEETRAQAAFLMATPEPEARFYRHLDGDESALPAQSDLNQQGVQRNLAIMQSWKLSVTPMNLYRSRDGSVKVIRGKPQDVEAMVSDLAPR